MGGLRGFFYASPSLLNKVLYWGGDTRRFNPLPFYIYTIFDRKGTFYLKNNTPYTYPTSLELCIPFSDCCKCTVLNINKSQKHKVFRSTHFFTAKKCICKPFRAFLQTEMAYILPFIYFNL